MPGQGVMLWVTQVVVRDAAAIEKALSVLPLIGSKLKGEHGESEHPT
jgi:hypothetical protein